MAKRADIVSYLDAYLNNDVIQDLAVNGLQVEGKDIVRKVALAVDACADVFEKGEIFGTLT